MCRLMTADQTKKAWCLACGKALYSMGPLIISAAPRNEPARIGYPSIIQILLQCLSEYFRGKAQNHL